MSLHLSPLGNTPISVGAVVLAGGRSTRMGYPKAWLPFGHETMLQRVVRLLHPVASPIVVVLAPQQQPPRLPPEVRLVHDPQEGQGPLLGLRAGLEAISSSVEAAFVTSCDVPLLVPAIVPLLASRLEAADAVAPFEGGKAHPLVAIYRVRILPVLDALWTKGGRRPLELLQHVRTAWVPVEELRVADPELATFRNLNRPADYLAALAEAGLTPDPTLVARLAQVEANQQDTTPPSTSPDT